MTGSINTAMRRIKKASMKQVHPIIENFFQRIPDDTWATLMIDHLDGSTKADLKELLRKVTVIISNSMIDSLTDQKQICEEDVLSTWGYVVPEAFALVLGASEDASCESADEFDNLIIAEVVRSVNAAIYTGQKTEVFENRLGGQRLNTLVHVANKMIKYYYMCSLKLQKKRKLDRKTKNLQNSNSKQNTPRNTEATSKADASDVASVLQDNITSLPPKVEQPPKNEVESSLESSLGEVLESSPCTVYLPEQLTSEVKQVTETADYPENTPPEVHLCEQPAPRASATEVSAKCSVTEPHTDSSEALKEKIQNLLNVADKSIWEMEAVPITAAPPQEHITWGVDSDDDDDKGLQEDIVELPVTPVTSLTSEEESLVSEMESSLEISVEELLELYMPEELTSEVKEVTETADDPENIPNEVHLCEQPAPRASATEVSAKRSVTEAHTDSNEAVKEKMFKLCVDVCAESLVQQLVRKAPQFFDEDDLHMFKTRLRDKFWAEIQNKYWNIPRKKFRKLDKLIYKDLRKDCKYTPYMLKQCMEQDDSPFEKAIIYYYNKHLAPKKKKHSGVRRIFSAVGSAITEVFRGSS